MRRRLAALLLTACLLSAAFAGTGAFGASGQKETRTQLVTACVFLWKSSAGVWQYGQAPGHPYTWGTGQVALTGDFDRSLVQNVRFYNNVAFDKTFDFGTPLFAWNPNPQFALDKDAYLANYYQNSLESLTATPPIYDPKTGTVQFSYLGTPSTDDNYRINVKRLLGMDYDAGVSEIYARMGVTAEQAKTAYPSVVQTLADMYPKEGQASTVEGYLYFAPFLIQYDVVPEAFLPPKVLIDCKATSMFIGLTTPVRGMVQNRNAVPVITRYRLTVNDTVLKSGTALQEAGKSLTVESTYTIPAATKPGKLFTFKLWAEQVEGVAAPERYLPREEGDPQIESPAYTAFVAAHTYVPQAGAWYRNDDPWLSGQAECKKTAVLQPEAPLDHSLNPAVIVK